MMHYTHPKFWQHYRQLPTGIRNLADKNFKILKKNPNHPSLHFKRIGRFWSVRVDIKYRALAIEGPQGLVWFWIGTHSAYDKLIKDG